MSAIVPASIISPYALAKSAACTGVSRLAISSAISRMQSSISGLDPANSRCIRSCLCASTRLVFGDTDMAQHRAGEFREETLLALRRGQAVAATACLALGLPRPSF
jgi:hypothetical protein